MTPTEPVSKSVPVRVAHRLGSLPSVYSLLRKAMGGEGYWRRLVHEVARIEPGERVLDIGCGPAHVIEQLPDGASYTGLDNNDRCIRQARRRYGGAAAFVEADAATVGELTGEFDTVLAMGLLHHLCDRDARAMLAGAARLLAPGGRLVTADVVATRDSSPSAAWLLARDRGDHVREAAGYRALIEDSFEAVDSAVATDLLRVPLTGAPFPLLIATGSPAAATEFADSREAWPARVPALALG